MEHSTTGRMFVPDAVSEFTVFHIHSSVGAKLLGCTGKFG